MKSDQRIELLKMIEKMCQRYPDWRFGQVVANLVGWAGQEIWDVEDEQLLEAARLHLRQLTMKYAEEQMRRVSSARGLDWDKMSDDEREALVDALVHENRIFA